jgi:hypothetical protein
MENNMDKKNTGEDTKNTLITIISVLVYIVYSLVKKSFEAIKSFNIKGIFAIVVGIALLILAITFWPLTLAIIATAILIGMLIFDPDMLG